MITRYSSMSLITCSVTGARHAHGATRVARPRRSPAVGAWDSFLGGPAEYRITDDDDFNKRFHKVRTTL
jgi:hypothetical protein